MANKVVLLDTSILIDYYRKKQKEKTAWYALVKQGFGFSVSAVTKFEIYAGANDAQREFWDRIFDEVAVLPFDDAVVHTAVEINQDLKIKRKQIGIADLFIAATAIANSLPISTLNKAHFVRIDRLELVE